MYDGIAFILTPTSKPQAVLSGKWIMNIKMELIDECWYMTLVR